MLLPTCGQCFMRLDTYAAIFWYALLLALHLIVFGIARLLSNCKARRQPVLKEEDNRAAIPAMLREGLAPSV